MANEKNLRPAEYKLSQEEAKKGGIASGKARKKKSDAKKMAKMFMELPLDNNSKKILVERGVEEDNVGYMVAMISGLVSKVVNQGDRAAFEEILDLIGQNDKTKNDRKKLRRELEFRERELEIRERELLLKEKEFEAKRGNSEGESVDRNSNIMSAIKALGIGENNGGN